MITATAYGTLIRLLKDPHFVHEAMLRGEIAKLSIPQFVRIYGIEAVKEYLAEKHGDGQEG